MLAPFVVTKMTDAVVNTSAAVGTLRQAVFDANQSQTGEDTIKFDETVFVNGGTIVLTLGQLNINETTRLVIDGRDSSGAPLGITIDANNFGTDHMPFTGDGFQIMNIQGSTGSEEVEINSLSFSGSDTFSSSVIRATYANLVLKNVVVTGNNGGAMIGTDKSNVTVENSTISGNSGRGIDFDDSQYLGRQLNVSESTISGNASFVAGGVLTMSGGGMMIRGFYTTTANIQSSVISGNESTFSGAGIHSYIRNLTVQSSTISDNEVTATGLRGGGLFAEARYGAQVTINQTVIENNRVNGFNSAGGGAYLLADNSTVSITNSTIGSSDSAKGNKALGLEANAAGIAVRANNEANVTVDRLNVTNNHADDDVGGLLVFNSGSTVVVKNSMISGNSAIHENGSPASYDGAGGVWLETSGGTTTVESSTISGNTSTMLGGGVFIKSPSGTTTILNSTISGNKAQFSGGGIKIMEAVAGGQVNILHSTITNNRADSDGNLSGTGGGIHRGNSTTTVTLDHTIVAKNFSGTGASEVDDDIGGSVTASWNLIGIDAGATITTVPGSVNQIGAGTPIDPMLGPLVYNGGPVFLDGSKMLTHSLLPTSPSGLGSPALNAGDPNAEAGNGIPEYDQRGNPWHRVDLVGENMVPNRIDIGAFEWQPNQVIGDYNFDGTVNAADYTVWRNTRGSTTDLRADGDLSGTVDDDDYGIWKINFGNPIGDASGNGVTDIADYNIWAATYESTTDLRADFNEDGIVDDADFDIWFDTYGTTLEIAQFGMLSNYFDPDAPPAVVGIALSLPGLSAMDFADKIGSGEQLRSAPVFAANTLNITFNRDVSITSNALQLVNLDGSSPNLFAFSYDALAQTATWTFTTSLADGRYLALLSDSVEDLAGNALDGEFFNPISLGDTGTATFPSGDGDAGGEFRFRFTVLSGDTDHDNIDGATDYTNWQSTEPGMIIVSTTTDEFDADLSFGDVSLREAVDYANTAGTATAIQLPAGRYVLTRTGTEADNASYNDLDILGQVAILGSGAGLTIVDNSGLTASMTRRAFEVKASGASVTLAGVTIANGTAAIEDGLAVRVDPGGSLELVDSALVNHTSIGGGPAIYADRGDVTIRRSVITDSVNQVSSGAAVYVKALNGSASVLIGDSIFALNHQHTYTGDTTKNVQVVGYVTKTNEGGNLYDDATGGFFDTTPGEGDYLGTPDYVVTSVADTFDHADDVEALSLREAVDLANQAAGQQEVWVPAWHFQLTRDRGSNLTDTDVSYGDLDISDSIIIRGVSGRTSVSWKPGVVDKVFDLLGDYNNDGEAGYGNVSAADYTIWQNQNGSSGGLEQFSADGDDDGDVDAADYDIWYDNYGNTLELLDIEV